MAVIMDDHIHLCNAGYFIVDLNSEKMLGCEIVPIVKVINCTNIIVISCLSTHIIERMQKKSSGTACWIKHIPIVLRFHHFYSELNNRTWGEILSEITLKEAIHELLKSNTFNVQICFAQVYRFQMGNNGAKNPIIDLNGVSENFGIFHFLLIVQGIDSLSQLGRWFMRFDLELVGFALLPRLLLITDFDKDELTELAKCRGEEIGARHPQSVL